ncbi:MAG: MerR family transcriptional regulator [Gordonibacter sp.]|uniref:MerR family transcriptional regulator n=1 Tax=Gordonibacter sp. TaxID=1968902 RepID=UPI003220673A
MLQIGEFARLSHISVRMLRHYDQEGLRKPAQQDRTSGYRSYAVSQLVVANRITTLRDLGFSIRDIKQLVEAEDAVLLAALDGRGRELEEGIARE